MGMIRILSSSSYDDDLKNPNPDPQNYQIVRSLKINDFLILKVNYPDCTTWEGNKILVYKGLDLKTLEQQKSLDPHFSNNSKKHSPVARFIPTDEGWNMAVFFCEVFI